MTGMDRRTALALLTGGALAAPWPALAAGKRMLSARIAIDSGRVIVAVGMNGKGPFFFMIDTGGYLSLIRDDLARQLSLRVQDYTGAAGAGGRGIYPTYRAENFLIGGGIRQPVVTLLGAGNLDYGPDIQGTLAAGILTAQDSDLDFDRGEMRIYPDGKGDRTGFVRVDSDLHGGERATDGSPRIYAAIAIEGRTFHCLVDTGAPRQLTLYGEAARQSGLWNDDRPYAPYRPSGIGGVGTLGRSVRATSLTFGGVTVDRPLVQLKGESGGGFGDGVIGLSLIRRFNLSIDARARRLWVQPNSRPVAPEPERYGLSGLWIDRDGDRITVKMVGKGSPAAGAGVRVGDRLRGDWLPILRAINGPPGSVVRLTVERDGATRDVDLKLAEYL